MIELGKKNILGILVDAVDYDAAVARIMDAARKRERFAVATVAVHGIIEGTKRPEQKFRLNQLDLVTPDGQPVRWALNLLYGTKLVDRVYGPNITLRLCEQAAQEGLGVYFYGNTPEVLSALRAALHVRFPRLIISGTEPSKFRKLLSGEREDLVKRISGSGAALVFVGLGCPRQDVWVYEYRHLLSLPTIAVGGAFGVIAGLVPQAPSWMQRHGLEWLFRLGAEPKRLWRRYVFLNPVYATLIILQILHLATFRSDGKRPAADQNYG